LPEAAANGVRLYYELHGSGDPLVLVHGSWVDAADWRPVVEPLARSFRVLVYDRRGHSRSERPASQGSVDEDGDDLAALLETLELGSAHVVTNSFGGNVALRLAARRPELFRSLCCHEPPLFALLGDDPDGQAILKRTGHSLQSIAGLIAAGDHEAAGRQFVEEVVLEPGAWDGLPRELRDVIVQNAPTFLDELQDPGQGQIDEAALARLEVPVHLTIGEGAPPFFATVAERLATLIPGATIETVAGGHAPQNEAPERYAEVIARATKKAPPVRGLSR
jgi:pimeloyl-ACP methyl ester carboxylesterase